MVATNLIASIFPKLAPKSQTISWKLGLRIVQLCFGLIVWCSLSEKAKSAEKIVVNYGALEFSLSIDSLKTFADTGNIEGDLASYANFLTPEQLENLKTSLNANAEFSHLEIAQFLYSYQGERILERASQVIKTTARQPGFYAIRSALILAAADEESGLTLLNILQKFPTDILRVDSGEGLEIMRELSQVAQRNAMAIAAVEQQAAKESTETATITPQIRNQELLLPGRYRYRQQQLQMNDVSRGRSFPVDLYLPQTEEQQLPLVVISHGLGSDLSTFAYFAQHLASHGFAVAVPEHPGSSSRQIAALLSGLSDDVTPPEEFIDRPLDIKFLLDRLAARFGEQIDTDNVGMIGQSFGGYTSLALAGAELNLDSLNQDCPDLAQSLNISWLLQCLGLQIPEDLTKNKLQDPRITAAIAINPLVSTVFNQEHLSQIEIPIMLVSGSADPITPALPEQIIPFTWLQIPEKYLVLLKGGTHFSVLNESAGSVPVPQKAIGPDPKIAQDYLKQIGLAFFDKHIRQQSTADNYLNAAYGTVISQEKLPLRLIESLDPNFLSK
ncbi:MAG: alpha/beta hydrolase [Cyanobacteria bacterium J06621_8]